MALTKEDLDNIKLPLSDEDYRMLRIEDAKSHAPANYHQKSSGMR